MNSILNNQDSRVHQVLTIKVKNASNDKSANITFVCLAGSEKVVNAASEK